jgi:hypothetical protein
LSPRVVAVMQPYFMAYPGYYRLLAGVDDFVLFDCVQFPRRGWVHRNRLPGAAGEPAWLTLPLANAPFDARIDEIAFADDAPARMAELLRRFPSLAAPRPEVIAALDGDRMRGLLVDYLERQLAGLKDLFGFQCRLLRSSSLAIDPALRAQDRILAILARLGATDYLNAPGGRDLYDEAAFAAAGVRLHFLPEWGGSFLSVLHELALRPPGELAADIRAQTPDFQVQR